MVEKKPKPKAKENKNIALAINVIPRGRIYKGIVTKVFSTRIVLELERTIYSQKYERYYKKKTRIHARIPANFKVHIGDLIKVQETRPLSKILHFQLIEIIKPKEK